MSRPDHTVTGTSPNWGGFSAHSNFPCGNPLPWALILATHLLWDTVIGPGMHTNDPRWANQKPSLEFLPVGAGTGVGRYEPRWGKMVWLCGADTH